jgi:hypothetical protein
VATGPEHTRAAWYADIRATAFFTTTLTFFEQLVLNAVEAILFQGST